jgi:predicted secreted protein
MAAIAFSFMSCNLTDNDKTNVDFEIFETDNGKTVSTKLNDVFNVALNECVGCAEVWTITKQDTTKIQLEQKSSRDRSCSDCVGGSLTRIFKFKCVEIGQSDLVLCYFDDTLKVTIDTK